MLELRSLTLHLFCFMLIDYALIGPLHDQVIWYKITHAMKYVALWDVQNKGRSRWTGTSCNLLPSMYNFVPCGRLVQRGYYIIAMLLWASCMGTHSHLLFFCQVLGRANPQK